MPSVLVLQKASDGAASTWQQPEIQCGRHWWPSTRCQSISATAPTV